MISVRWQGFIVSENRRHAMRIKVGHAGESRAVISPQREYQAFVANLATTIMAEGRRQGGVRRYSSLSLLVQCSIGPKVDGQNLLKPICDAVQRSRLLTNDRNIRHRSMLPDERHAEGKVDTIWLSLYELVETDRQVTQ